MAVVPIEFDIARLTDRAEVVRATALCKSIDGRPVLDDVHLSIPAGSFVALLGANGAGKSTLLKVLATLVPPTSGHLELFGRPAAATGRGAEQVRRSIGLIGHQSMLFRDLSARENLEFFGRLYGIPDPRGRAEGLLGAVGLLDRADDPVRNYSRDMAQRVAIARALVHDPQLLLADEPFDGLDAPSAATLEQLLADLHAAGKTLILANHDIAQSLRLAQRAVVLREGRVNIDKTSTSIDAADVLAAMERGSGHDDGAQTGRAAGRQGPADRVAHPPDARPGRGPGAADRHGPGAGLGPAARRGSAAATAVLWVAYLFAGVLCFEKTMAVERQDRALTGLLLAPVDRGVI